MFGLAEGVAHVLETATRVIQLIHQFNEEYGPILNLPLEAKIGIHMGPIVAGVIGRKKFAYDIWGDVVNTASRMQSTAEPGTIQISDKVWGVVKDDNRFVFQERGELDIKGKGKMRTHFLKAFNGGPLKTSFSSGSNKDFPLPHL